MSISFTHDVFCDICHYMWENCFSAYHVDKSRANKIAKEKGWERKLIDGELKHICPACWKIMRRIKNEKT